MEQIGKYLVVLSRNKELTVEAIKLMIFDISRRLNVNMSVYIDLNILPLGKNYLVASIQHTERDINGRLTIDEAIGIDRVVATLASEFNMERVCAELVGNVGTHPGAKLRSYWVCHPYELNFKYFYNLVNNELLQGQL